jgi:hypothetical protein
MTVEAQACLNVSTFISKRDSQRALDRLENRRCRGKPNNLRLEIGHVLFIDIVGYLKLLIQEQKERLNQLTEIVLATMPVREATEEQLVRLPTGDGMALVFRS